MGLHIEQPLFLLLFIPVIAVLFLFWKTVKLHSTIEKITLMSFRFFIFSLIIIVLAGPYLTFTVEGVTTVFVVDHSESVKNQQNEMYGTIEQAVEAMEQQDSYAIVAVAENGQVVQGISDRNKGIISNTVLEDTAYTNLEEGLQVASSILSSNHNGRIVLLTDGNENMGEVKRQIKLLKSQKIEVDVIPFTTTIERDVVLEEFEVAEDLFLGEQTTINTTISSTVDTTSRVRISNNNELIIDEEVQVKQGTNVFSFQYLVESTGTHSFRAEIGSTDDGIPENNIRHAISNVKGTPRVLIVEGTEGEATNIASVFQASGLQVNIVSPGRIPTALTGILEYESIIFSNVSATDVTQQQMEIIESAVRDFGLGFIMTGGNMSFGLGGYFKTPIEKVLPVEMDLKGKKELPSLGLIIVLDRSGSMSGYKMDLAKEAAARSVELLREKDTLGFIAFDDQPWQIIETVPLDNKKEAAENIRSITEGGGTNIYPALALAYEQLEKLDLKRKHIILLTDGQSATTMDYHELISEGLKHNVTLSTVAIGSDADRMLLEDLALEGTGRYYDVQDASTIPSILSRETLLTTRTYIEDNPFYPTLIQGTEWSSIFTEGIPQMNVYVATEPKTRAQSILVSDKNDPVLSRWQYGLGNTVAWTSDVSGEWAGDFVSWEKWPTLWNEILSWSLPTYQQEMYYIEQHHNGKEITLNVTSDDDDILPLEASIVDENGKELESQIRPTAPGEHEVTFQANTGVYFLQLSKFDQDKVVGTYQTGIVIPYSKEFELTNHNESLLKEMTDISEGLILKEPRDAFRELANEKTAQQPIFMPLLLVAFLLFFVEIAVRRFGLLATLKRFASLRDKGGLENKAKKEKVNQTFEQLKSAKTKKSKNQTVVKTKRENSTSSPVRKQEKQSNQEKQIEKIQSDDRMKRLLEAKNRKNK